MAEGTKDKGKKIIEEPDIITEKGESSEILPSNEKTEEDLFNSRVEAMSKIFQLKKNWGDIDQESEKEYESDSEEDEGNSESSGDLEEGKIVSTGELGKLLSYDESPCLCKDFSNIRGCLEAMSKMSELELDQNNYNCICNNLIKCYNLIFKRKKKNLNSKYKVAFTDYFYRVRHEILSKGFLMTFNLPQVKTDTPFSEFGIMSSRTPDFIIEQEGTIYVFEITASNSFEKAAVTKGMEQMGFDSKYKKEMEMFKDQGLNSIYLPLFFNMADTYNPVNKDQINKIQEHFKANGLYKNILNQIARSFSYLSINMRGSLVYPSSVLFNEPNYIEKTHKGHEFLYNTNPVLNSKLKYREMVVSDFVFKKITDNWSRLEEIAERKNFLGGEKFIFFIETNSHKINCEKNRDGITEVELSTILKDYDKIKLFKFFYLKSNGIYKKCTESETGVKLIEPTKTSVESEFSALNILVDHKSTPYKMEESKKYLDDILCFYKKKCNSYDESVINCNFYDENYEEKIVKSILEFDKNFETGYSNKVLDLNFGPKLLGQLKVTKSEIKESLEKIEPAYFLKNTENDALPMTILKEKNPFLMPLCYFNKSSYCKLDYKNKGFISELIKRIDSKNEYTCMILSGIMRDSYLMYTEKKVVSDTLQSLYNQRFEISNELNRLFKMCKRKNEGLKKLKDLSEGEDREIYLRQSDKFRATNKIIKAREREEKTGKEISYLRLSTKNKKGAHYSSYKKEMSHFKEKKVQSTIEGVGFRSNAERDFEKDSEIFSMIGEELMLNSGENPDKLYDNFVSEDCCLLYELKEKSVEMYSSLKESFENSSLGHSCGFVSRLGHSLMFYSQQSFSSDYIRVDNLGYKNVLLIVKGGKKIFKSKSSKLFRLIAPIYPSTINWLKCGHFKKCSTQVFEMENNWYMITPWAYMHENTLCDSISFYQRVGSFTILNSEPKVDLSEQFYKIQMNVMLAFHNRRNTEVLLANLRYILLSTMGEYTGVSEILEEFFGFNYDCFQSYIRNCILFRYKDYFDTLHDLKEFSEKKEITENLLLNSSLKNIFNDRIINKTEELALMIYSTFLMTKAPYQKLIERANNLKGILKIHEYYTEKVGSDLSPKSQLEKLSVTLEDSYEGYAKGLFENDFNFDPKYCALIGNFMDSYFLNNLSADVFHIEWSKIINKNWDEMATSTGLRGDYNNLEDFWGKKGYFVVYKEILSDTDFKNTMISVLGSAASESEKRGILKNMNMVFKNYKPNTEKEFLIFHAVDKTQWRGNREIYVMDIDTKAMQQPIEKFMGFVCSKMDNELISIPSNKRAQMIHHSIFEKDTPLKDTLTWYLTLDCSKWAPKSIFSKFSICLNNMSCIPNNFKIHLLNYFERLYNKRLYFNKNEVEVLRNNPTFSKACKDFLKKDDHVDGYYLEASYSWVMGIFNYMSSFLHAANQKYFSYLLNRTSLKSFNEETTMVMYAHSDDSGGRISVSNRFLLQRAVILYEVNLHAANHLLSRKKSVISRIYFEILSVIYMFKKLMALLPKFLGGLRFLPTDKGPAQDILQSYSKCIEVITAGADFSIAYIVLKMMAYLVFRFYFNRSPKKIDYEKPGQYMGMPDSHPIMALLCGTDADILRLIRTESGEKKLMNQMAYVNGVVEDSDGEGPIKPLKFKINVKNLDKDFGIYCEFFEEYLKTWSVKNVNYHNTGMNMLSFLAKLKDPGFVGSLINESQVRRLSRSYYFRYSSSLITKNGNVKMSKFVESLDLVTAYFDDNKAVKEVFGEILSAKSVQEMEEDFLFYLNKSEVHLNIMKRTLLSPLKLLNYFNKLSLKNRNFIHTNRTLKPAMVQLNKGGQVFSVDFDPAVLVSFCKEPDMKWALTNLKNVNTAKEELESYLSKFNRSLEDLSPDLLMRVCRSFGRDNVKNIYIYSRTPSEMRQIKTYTSFLTFLSVNSFNKLEIEGLTINLSDRVAAKEYVTANVSTQMYLINGIICCVELFLRKCGRRFMQSLNINEIVDLNFQGGGIQDLMDSISQELDESIEGFTCSIQLQILRKLIDQGELITPNYKKGAFYTFLKSQKSRAGWYGVGELYISIQETYYCFKLKNNELTELFTNKLGKLNAMHEKYILDVLENTGLQIPNNKPRYDEKVEYCFGYDYAGGLGVYKQVEIGRGVKAKFKEIYGHHVTMIDYFEVLDYKKDYLLLRDETSNKVHKLQVLPLKKAEIIDVVRLIFDKRDFEEKLIEEGLNDFEDYIMTEVLPDFGTGLYINFNQYIDNYAASRTYQVLQECTKLSLYKTDLVLKTSVIPAQEGSLLRVLINYTMSTKDKVVKLYKNIDSEMMKVRSEYPEQVSVIMQDKLLENYKNLYDKKETKEITDSYMKILKSEDENEIRAEVIKLMSYWGYVSLVNNVEVFKLLRSSENYVYFNLKNCLDENSETYSNLYPKVCSQLLDLIETYKSEIDPNSYKVKDFLTIERFENFKISYIKNLCYDAYSNRITMFNTSITELVLNNTLYNLLQDEEFCADLQQIFDKQINLSSLSVSFKDRDNIIVLLNTLRFVWFKKNCINHPLNSSLNLQRFPSEIRVPGSLSKTFDVSLPPKYIYYNGFLESEILNYITTDKKINLDKRVYYLKNKIKKLSKNCVPMNRLIEVDRPLKNSVFGEDDWEDLIFECEMADMDEETILSLWEDLKSFISEKRETKIYRGKSKTVVRAEINWIVLPYQTNSGSISGNVRQCGENIVIISTCCLDWVYDLKNSGVRFFKTRLMKEPIFLHYLFQKELCQPDFLNDLLGGRDFSRQHRSSEPELLINCVRDDDGEVKPAIKLGTKEVIRIMTGEIEQRVEENFLVEVPKKEGEKEGKEEEEMVNKDVEQKVEVLDREKENKEKLKSIELLEEKLKDIKEKFNLSPETYNKLRNLGMESLTKGMGLSLIFESLMKLGTLEQINQLFSINKLGLSFETQRNMQQNPKHFSTVSRGHANLKNSLSDKKMESEFDSVYPGLTKLIMSGNLTITPRMEKICKSNMRMWVNVTKGTSHKKENKLYLIQKFALIYKCSSSDPSSDTEKMWQDIINEFSLYISQELEDSDDEISSLFENLFISESSARLKYKVKGFE